MATQKLINQLREQAHQAAQGLTQRFAVRSFICPHCEHGTIYLGPPRNGVYHCQNRECCCPLGLMSEYADSDMLPIRKEKQP